MTEEDIYRFFNGDFIEYYRLTTALIDADPEQVNSEVRQCFTHLARTHHANYDNKNLEFDLFAAFSHLQRAAIDCLQLIILAAQRDLERFDNQTDNFDLSRVSNGKFQSEYQKMKSEATNKSKYYLQNENDLSTSDRYSLLEEIAANYLDAKDLIDKNLVWVNNAKGADLVERISTPTVSTTGWLILTALASLISIALTVLFLV